MLHDVVDRKAVHACESKQGKYYELCCAQIINILPEDREECGLPNSSA